MDAPKPASHFYAEHVEADAVHEQVVRVDVVGDLVAPNRSSIATWYSESGQGMSSRTDSPTHMMECWAAGRSSLRRPLS